MRIIRTQFLDSPLYFPVLTNMIFLNQSPGLYPLAIISRSHCEFLVDDSWWDGFDLCSFLLVGKTRMPVIKIFVCYSCTGTFPLPFLLAKSVLITIMNFKTFLPKNSGQSELPDVLFSTSMAMIGLFLAFKMFKNFIWRWKKQRCSNRKMLLLK